VDLVKLNAKEADQKALEQLGDERSQVMAGDRYRMMMKTTMAPRLPKMSWMNQILQRCKRILD